MKNKSHLQLSSKLIIMMLLVSLLAISIVGVIRIIWSTDKASNTITENLTAVTNLISAQSDTALSFSDSRLSDANLKALENISSVRFSCIFTKNGDLFSDYQRPGGHNYQCPPFNTIEQSEVVFSDDSILIYKSILLGSEVIGHLYLNSDKSRIDEITQEQIIFSLIALLSSAIFVFLIAYWVQRIVSHPVSKITEIANTISTENDHELRVDLSSNDEIGQLAKSFNYMLDSLQLKQEEQAEILNSMLDGVITINEQGLILTFNQSAERIFGYASQEIIGKNISYLMPDPYARMHDNYIKNYCKDGKSYFIGTNRTVSAKRENGEVFPLSLSIAELSKNLDGQRRFIGSCIDLTKEKMQEEQLRRTQKMDAIGQLTSGIAHDFNNMLGVILGYSDLLSESLEDNKKLKKYVDQILKAGKRGSKLSKKLLSFSKRDLEEAETLDINNILNDSKEMIINVLTSRIKLELSLESTSLIKIVPNELEDVIINMCINASHAIELAGTVEIKTEDRHLNVFEAKNLNLITGEYVVLSIKDDGKGMDQQIRDKIFEPFFTTKGDKGTGLGLSQAYAFVERSRGAITLESSPGKGTEFIMYFPKYDYIDKVVSVNEKHDTKFYGNESILAVDDEEQLLKFISDSLRIYGYHVYTAKTPKEAMKILKNNSIDMVISDVVMPEMDGFELSRYIQKKYPNIKIQLVSGYENPGDLGITELNTSYDLLSKPYDTSLLLNSIKSHLH